MDIDVPSASSTALFLDGVQNLQQQIGCFIRVS